MQLSEELFLQEYDPSQFERAKFEMFQAQCKKYLEYVEACIAKNGEAETFFFE